MKQQARAARCPLAVNREEDAASEASYEYSELEGGMIREFTIHIL